MWARQKAAFGWKPRAFILAAQRSGDPSLEHGAFPLLVLTRRIAGPYSLSYVPHAPVLEDLRRLRRDLPPTFREAKLGQLLSAISRALRPFLQSSICLRFDLNWSLSSPFHGPLAGRVIEQSPVYTLDQAVQSTIMRNNESNPSAGEQSVGQSKPMPSSIPWENCGLGKRSGSSARSKSLLFGEPPLIKASADIQPPDTVIIDIDPAQISEEQLLADMKSKTRYNIRLAEKKGVQVRRIQRGDYLVPSEFHQWYDLYRIVEERNRIAVHPRRYYAALFESTRDEQCSLYLAEHQGDLLAGIIVIKHRSRAWYLYGASSNLKRNLMPTYALQWQAIRDMRLAGVVQYDMFGIPPFAESGHPMFGLYQFKTGFAGRIVHTPGAWDRPLRPMIYRCYRLAEMLRMYYFRVLKKRRSSSS